MARRRGLPPAAAVIGACLLVLCVGVATSSPVDVSSDAASNNYEGDYVPYAPAYHQVAAGQPIAAAMYARTPGSPSVYRQTGGSGNMAGPQCDPCGPPPCPNPCPPPPSAAAAAAAAPVPCVTEIPAWVQYLIIIATIGVGLSILKWYCSAMSELDRQCGLDDRAEGGRDGASGGLAMKRSSFRPPMATISAYYDPMTNQVLLPQQRPR